MSLNLVNSIIVESIEETNTDSKANFDIDDDVNNNNIKLSTAVTMVLHETDDNFECPKIILSPCNENLSGTTPLSPTSLNLSSSFRIKGILKKPRSYSYSESETISVIYNNNSNKNNSNHAIETRKSFCSSGCNSILTDETSDTCGSKKCVSFNNQVIRNVFKPGSTIVGMKKPNSNKNKKKNKRRRTLSDPSHDNDKTSEDESSFSNRSPFLSIPFRRCKSISESSDDNSSIVPITSDDTSHDSHCSHDSHDSSVPSDTNSNPDSESEKKKKKRKRKKKNKNKNDTSSLDNQNSDIKTNQQLKDVFNMDHIAKETLNIIINKND